MWFGLRLNGLCVCAGQCVVLSFLSLCTEFTGVGALIWLNSLPPSTIVAGMSVRDGVRVRRDCYWRCPQAG
jgi:hypothetical protein